MKTDYKIAQRLAKFAGRIAKHGKEIVCSYCGIGSSGGTLIKTGKGKYQHHKNCR